MSAPFSTSPAYRAASRKGAASPLVLAIAAVSGLILVSCLVCGGLVYFGVNTQATSQIQEKYGENPVILEHLGEIHSAWINTEVSHEVAEEFGTPDYIVYDVHGSEGDGLLIIKQGEGDNFVGDEGFLRIDSEDYEL
ncbi:hypothetical protein [Bremerella alba]|uniref:Uncharacterized protein n=1 Tax=Bremerella alba TaxID=980252 RepID=A0A7V9A6Y2_9BACT|nr:hypothetical protein [Bremerella alba]MBA2114426.1 hypothetical protein [Bremerella alba]